MLNELTSAAAVAGEVNKTRALAVVIHVIVMEVICGWMDGCLLVGYLLPPKR